ncbi:MAG TPA: response regulator [Beijerinckiaceae bacterium]|nr:response regulator [Beijerinckiaceae bacterium]
MTISSQAALAGRRVLVVEDEYFVADDIARALHQLGADVVGPFASRDEALACFFSDDDVDIAVLDINVRGEMIYPLAEALRERGVPFVFATGYAEASLPSTYRNIPRWEKPFDPKALADVLPGLPPPRDDRTG